MPCWPMGEAMYCSSCGAAQPDRARFCSRCGSQLDADSGADSGAGADSGEARQAPPEASGYRPPGGYPPPPSSASGPTAEYRRPEWSPSYGTPGDYPPPPGSPRPYEPPDAYPPSGSAPSYGPPDAYPPAAPPPSYRPPDSYPPDAYPPAAPPPSYGPPDSYPPDAYPPAAPPPSYGPPDAYPPDAYPPAAPPPSYGPPDAYPPAGATPPYGANAGYSPPASGGYGPSAGYSPPGGAPYPPGGSYPPGGASYPPPPGGAPYPPAQPAAPAYTPPRRRRGTALVAVAAVFVVLGGLAAAGWKQHWPPALFGHAASLNLTWSPAEAPLPGDAAQSSNQSAGLNDVACSGAHSCVAVGYYLTSNSDSKGLIETLSGSTWTPAAAPSDLPASQVSFAQVAGVACPAQGACVAVGSNYTKQNVERATIDTLSGGTWTAAEPPLPSDAGQSKAALLSQVTCPARGTCVAAGWYTDQNNHTQALIETLSGGSWRAQRAPLPAGANPGKASSSTLPTGLFVVKCAAVGTCVAAGDYTDASGGSQGLIETLSGGSWTAARAPLPADAAASPVAFLFAIACPAPGSCLIGGHYNSRSGQSKGLAEIQSGGTWTLTTAPLPKDAAASQKWNLNQITGLTAAACTAPATCVAAGSYDAQVGGVEGLIDTLSGGTWKAVRAPLPAGAVTTKQYIFFNGAACQDAGDCVVVGGYKSADGGSQGLIETGATAGSK